MGLIECMCGSRDDRRWWRTLGSNGNFYCYFRMYVLLPSIIRPRRWPFSHSIAITVRASAVFVAVGVVVVVVGTVRSCTGSSLPPQGREIRRSRPATATTRTRTNTRFGSALLQELSKWPTTSKHVYLPVGTRTACVSKAQLVFEL